MVAIGTTTMEVMTGTGHGAAVTETAIMSAPATAQGGMAKMMGEIIVAVAAAIRSWISWRISVKRTRPYQISEA